MRVRHIVCGVEFEVDAAEIGEQKTLCPHCVEERANEEFTILFDPEGEK